MIRAVTKIVFFGCLMMGCAPKFPDPPNFDDAPNFRSDAGFGSQSPGDQADATQPRAQNFPMRPQRPNPVGCQHEWPRICGIDCDNEPRPNQLLWIRPDEQAVLPAGEHRYACALIEGTLRIQDYVHLDVDSFILGALGEISGRGQGRDSLGDGGNGDSEYGRGSGGGGGSGLCEGGASAALDDGETRAGAPGNLSADMTQPGGDGGRGGDLQRQGGESGRGGASLGVTARACLLSGEIDVSGTRGEDAQNGSDGGGGGGGAGGNIDITCTDTQFNLSTISLFANGGRGGNGGTVIDRDGAYHGGGGGGGAAGLIRLTVDIGTLIGARGETPIRSNAAFLEDMRRRLSVLGGRGGSGGEPGEMSLEGDNGSNCRINVFVATADDDP